MTSAVGRPQRQAQQLVAGDGGAQRGGVVAQLADLGGRLVDEAQLRRRRADGAAAEQRVGGRAASSKGLDAGGRQVEAVAAHEQVQPGGVAAAHLEAVEGRQRHLDRRARLDGRGAGAGAGELADEPGGAEAVALDGPGRVLDPQQRGVGGLEGGALDGRRRRARASMAATARQTPSTAASRPADEVGRAEQGAHAGHAAQERVGLPRGRRRRRRGARGRRRRLASREAASSTRSRTSSGLGWLPVERRRTTAMMPHMDRARLPLVRDVLIGAPALEGRSSLRAASTAATRRPATSAAWASVVASTMTRTSGSVPLGRSSTRPPSPSSASAAATSARRPRSSRSSGRWARRTLRSTCGSRSITDAELGERPAGAGDDVGEVDAGEQPVAGGGEVALDDVARLLAAERAAAGLHRLEHVAVADGGVDDGHAVRGHRQAEPEVGHHRDDDGVVRQRAPRSRRSRASTARIWSPSTTAPAASTAMHRSASPSRARPRSAPRSTHGSCRRRLGVRGPAAVVDVRCRRAGRR